MLKPDERSGQLNHTQQKLIIKITEKKLMSTGNSMNMLKSV